MPLLALLLAANGVVCPPQKLQAARFAPGESLSYRVDVLGVDVGTFEVHANPPPAGDKRASLEITSRARTSAFVSTNAGRYDAYAVALLGPDLAPIKYREDVDDGSGVHRAVELQFPPANGSLPVQATRNGEPEPFSVSADPGVRDIISTLYLFRAQSMKPGAPVCLEVFAGRKIWKLTGQVAPAKESIETPLGRFATVRVDAEAVLLENPKYRRSAHVWVTDDERRLPVVAIGEMRGKMLRAQLVSAGPAKRSRLAGK